MRIYMKNNPAKFHPGPIWNDGALGFLDDGRPNNNNNDNNNNNNKMSSDMQSVPDLKKPGRIVQLNKGMKAGNRMAILNAVRWLLLGRQLHARQLLAVTIARKDNCLVLLGRQLLAVNSTVSSALIVNAMY